MPALLPMRSVGTASKARSSRSARTVARSKAEKEREVEAGGATLLSVPTMNAKGKGMGLLSTQLRACGAVANGGKGVESDAEKVRSRLFGYGVDLENRFGNQYVSSGSEHELNSVCLGAMVDGFIEDDDNSRCGRSRCNCKSSGSMCDCDDFEGSRSSLGGELAEILQDLIGNNNATERVLLAEVNKAIAMANCAESKVGGESTCLRRLVMKHLRTGRYNAAICKSRWEQVGSFPGGDYEYIDVVFESATGKSERIIIDIDFRGQFEIARPSTGYKAVVQVLPTVFVGKADQLFHVVNILSDAVKQSIKKSGMELPPWRKPEYMRAKWFSTYKRTTNDSTFKTHDADISNISRIAVRENGWSTKYTDEMEVDYLRVGDRQKNLVPKKPIEVSINKPSAPLVVINNNDWTPPALKPRVFQRRGQAGLASILREAGLTSSIRTLIEEQRTEWKSLPIAV